MEFCKPISRHLGPFQAFQRGVVHLSDLGNEIFLNHSWRLHEIMTSMAWNWRVRRTQYKRNKPIHHSFDKLCNSTGFLQKNIVTYRHYLVMFWRFLFLVFIYYVKKKLFWYILRRKKSLRIQKVYHMKGGKT